MNDHGLSLSRIDIKIMILHYEVDTSHGIEYPYSYFWKYDTVEGLKVLF